MFVFICSNKDITFTTEYQVINSVQLSHLPKPLHFLLYIMPQLLWKFSLINCSLLLSPSFGQPNKLADSCISKHNHSRISSQFTDQRNNIKEQILPLGLRESTGEIAPFSQNIYMGLRSRSYREGRVVVHSRPEICSQECW